VLSIHHKINIDGDTLEKFLNIIQGKLKLIIWAQIPVIRLYVALLQSV